MRLLVAVAGDEGWSPDQVVEVDDEVADAWCDGVRAERVDDSDPLHKPAAEVDLSRVSIEELWAEMEARGVTRRDDVSDNDKSAEPKSQSPAGTKPEKRRGRPPKGEQATAPPGGEQR